MCADVGKPPTDTSFISLKSVSLRLKDQLVFERTDWEIKSNEQWAIIGPNGSGKSTLANAILRTVPFAEGQISYYFDYGTDPQTAYRSYFEQGEIIKVSPESHRMLVKGSGYHQSRWNSIGSLDQPVVSEVLSGRSIEQFTRFHVGPTRTDESIYQQRRDQAVRLLDIEYLLDRKVTHLSNGETRKVLLVRALMQAPKLLILDDPFSGLDNQTRQTIRSAVDDLFATGNMRILLITARLDEIPKGITHVVRVNDCEIVEMGECEILLKAKPPKIKLDSGQQLRSRFNFHLPQTTSEKLENQPLLVDMKDVSVTYGRVQVLQNIDWQMKTGENWAIFGPNGAGKTTILSLILADNPQAYSNNISLFGIKRGSGESIWEIKQKIGWVSPELHVFYHRGLSCMNVIRSGFFDSVGLYKNCTIEQDDTAEKWMQSMGINHLANRLYGSLSVGEQRLVLICRALVKNPELLILDEPCQGLDFKNRWLIIELLDELCRQLPVNLIYVTHHFDEIPKAISHILSLKNGHIKQKGIKSHFRF